MSKATSTRSSNLQNILAPAENNLKSVEALLMKNLEAEIPLLTEIGHYIIQSGGKRLRPALSLLAAGAFGLDDERACLAASVIEYIHTASLLHDDVVDHAEMRRSKKTARTVWGNEASVLVGDYLFTISFKYLAELKSMGVIEIMAKATSMMARGEILQLIRSYETASEEEYLEIVIHKTACLIGGGMCIGAILGDGTPEQVDALYNCGLSIGIAYQMVDDTLDYSLERGKIGKPMGIDLKERKITLPLSHLLEKASLEDKTIVLDILDADEINDDNVLTVTKLMHKYQSLEYAKSEARKYVEKAKKGLNVIPDNKYKKSIIQIADYIVERVS